MTSRSGARVRQMRIVNGLGQVELSQRIGVASGAISAIENGRALPSSDQLANMARVFGCTPRFLARDDAEILTSRPWLRAYADAPKRQVDQQLADIGLAAEVVAIGGLRRLPDVLPRFDGDPTDDHAIEQFASEVRTVCGLNEHDVVGNTIRSAEKLGCLVLPMGEELGRHLGMSVWADQRPVICVSRPSDDPQRNVPGDRQRFTVAHELGHLTLHSEVPPPQSSMDANRIEKQAHRFASAFLAPGDAIVDDLEELGGRVTLGTLAKLKGRWGISIKALVVRYRSLGVIDDAHARSLYKQISSRGWNKAEPVTVGNEAAIWFQKAAAKAATNSTDPLAEIATATGVARRHLARWVDWSPTSSDEEAADVIDLSERRSNLSRTV